MDKILVCTKNKETTVCYAFTYSPSGTLDYDQKVDVPENLSEYQKFSASQYFKPSDYDYLSPELQPEIHIYLNKNRRISGDVFAYLTHIGMVLVAVEKKDSLLAAELLNKRENIFAKFSQLTCFLIRSIAPFALFSWIYGRFSDETGFLTIYEDASDCIAKNTTGILFAAAKDALEPDPIKESPEEMFIRYFQKVGHGDFTLSNVGASHHIWKSDDGKINSFLKRVIADDILQGTCCARQKKMEFYANLKVSVQAEPYNPYDSNAIGVAIENVLGKLCGNGGMSKAGYIRRTAAKILRRAFPDKYAYDSKLERIWSVEKGYAQESVILRVYF